MSLTLPFLWGAATSAHQVEVANSGSDWYALELRPDPGSPWHLGELARAPA